MNKKEKILDFIKSRTWGEAFFQELEWSKKPFDQIVHDSPMDRWIVFWYAYVNYRIDNDWKDHTIEYMKWYDEQNFED